MKLMKTKYLKLRTLLGIVLAVETFRSFRLIKPALLR
jgi:hypothetical protein